MMKSGRSRQGGIIVFVAICFCALIGLAGLVIDGGNLYLVRQRMQSAADAGALGAALLIPATGSPPVNQMQARAQQLIQLNGIQGSGLSVTINTPYGNGPNANRRVQVISRISYTPLLLAVLGVRDVPISLHAVGEWRPPAAQTFNPFGADGIIGRTGVSFSGNANINSWDSTLGPYGGTNVGSQGNVYTDGNFTLSGNGDIQGTLFCPGTVNMSGNASIKNVNAEGNVTMSGNAEITQNLVTNGTLNTSGNAAVNGTTTQNANIDVAPINLPPVDHSQVSASNNNASIPGSINSGGTPPSLSASGNTDVTLPPGTYYLNNITISGNARIRISGPTIIHMTGNLSVSGNGWTNNRNSPNNLLIYSSGNSVTWSGNAEFAGGVYAPNAAMNLSGNGEIYGQFIANSITSSGNGMIGLDRGLVGNLPGGSPTDPIHGLRE